MWSSQLHWTSDGTSSYDKGWTGTAGGKGNTDPDPQAPVGICRRNGHWFGADGRCDDCLSTRDASGQITYPGQQLNGIATYPAGQQTLTAADRLAEKAMDVIDQAVAEGKLPG